MLTLRNRHFVIFTTLAPFALAGCGFQVPSMDSPLDKPVSGEPSVMVTDIVKRTKCELYWALKPYLPEQIKAYVPKTPNSDMFDKKDPRYWLASWNATAQFELTLNDQGAVNPGVSIVEPMVNSYNVVGGASSIPLGKPAATFSPTVAAAAQNFTMGFGGGDSTQAARTDDVQFSVSIPELVGEFGDDNKLNDGNGGDGPYYRCPDSDSDRLDETAYFNSHLGLKEWIASALGPTLCFPDPAGPGTPDPDACPPGGFRYLRPGYHPKVSSNAPQKPKTLPSKPTTTISANLTAELRGGKPVSKAEFEILVAEYKGNILKLDKIVDVMSDNLKKAITPAYPKGKPICPFLPADLAEKYAGDLNDVQKAWGKAVKAKKAADDAAAKLQDNGNFSGPAGLLNTALQNIASAGPSVDNATQLGDDFKLYMSQSGCKIPQSAPKTPALDPPLDNIQHTVQFLVAVNVSATPSWTFARLKTGTAPSLAALSHSNTQSLIIVIGPATSSTKSTNNQAILNTQSTNLAIRQLGGP